MSNTDLYKEELEELTGKIYNGDLTPLVFDLLKESPYLDVLLHELTGKEITAKPEDEVQQPTAAPKFEDWFKNCKRLR
jgi:hypothetical protein